MAPFTLLARAMFAGVLSVTLALPVGAQCALQWQPGASFSGPGGFAADAVLLPNGDLVVGGQFVFADRALANNVARFDGTTWQPLGSGTSGFVLAVAAMPNGDIVAGGRFTLAGGALVSNIARWDGTSWSPLGAGVNNDVNALMVMPNGDLIAGGLFATAGGVTVNRIARWDGTTWSPLGTGVNHVVHCLALRPNGELIVGGSFSAAGGVATRGLATWNGSAWGAMPGLDQPSSVMGAAPLPNGQIAIVGSLTIGSTASEFGLANGTSVQTVPVPAGPWNDVAVRSTGEIVIGGYAITAQSGNVLSWNGTVWTQIGSGAPARTMKLLNAANGDLIATGIPFGTGSTVTRAATRYAGTTWTYLGAPQPPRVNAMVTLPDGDVILGGDFASFRGVAASNVARWHDGTITPLGLGVDGPVTSIALATDGTVVVCGEFANAGGGPANHIARWNGSTWTTVGGGLPWAGTTVAAAGGGQVLAKFNSLVRYFDGSTWSPFVLPPGYGMSAFAAAPEGDFILGGYFPGSGAQRFSHGLLSPTSPVLAIASLANDVNGNVLALVSDVGAYTIRRLVGNAWSAALGGGGFPLGDPTSLSSLPNGDVFVTASWITENALVRFDGTAWTVLESGLSAAVSSALPIVVSGTGDVLIGGDVRAVHGNTTAGFAHAKPACPSAAVPIGTGCFGAGGPLSLVADNLPWIGGTFRSTATGFTATSLAVHAIGTQPLAAPLPLGAPGCSLFVQPDVLDLLLPVNGTAAADFAVPRSTALAGLQARTQVVGIELDAFGNLIRLTSTNALQLTIGGL